MFQFRAFPSYAYFVQRTIPKYCSGGFPHSEISGSTDICSSPKLIAACHVLLRLLMPRHSPCALYSLTKEIFWFSWIMQAINRLLRKIVIVYPHLFRCSTIKYHKLLSTNVERPLCCLAFHLSSLFSFQGTSSSLFWSQILRSNPLGLKIQFQIGLVGPSGLEPPTLRLSVARSSQLSYGPKFSFGGD